MDSLAIGPIWLDRPQSRLERLRLLFGRALVYLLLAVSPLTAYADLWSFCTGDASALTQSLKDLHDAQCPAYLQSQFVSAGASVQGAQATTLQNQTQALSSIEGLLKAPASQVASGADISNLAIAAQVNDARTTYELARSIGARVRTIQTALSGKILVAVSPSDAATLVATPVNPELVLSQLKLYIDSLEAVKCPKPGVKAQVASATVAIGLAAVSVVANLASAFQPALVAAGKAPGVQDASQLIMAGLLAGMDKDAPNLYTLVPLVAANNEILGSVNKLQEAIVRADGQAKDCPDAPGVKFNGGDITAARAYLSTISTSTNSNPSVLETATRKQQILQSGIRYVLFVQRDASGGGIAAIKPNWFQSTQLVLGGADVITYRLVGYPEGDNVTANFAAGVATGIWEGTCGLDDWSSNTGGCIASVKVVPKIDGIGDIKPGSPNAGEGPGQK